MRNSVRLTPMLKTYFRSSCQWIPRNAFLLMKPSTMNISGLNLYQLSPPICPSIHRAMSLLPRSENTHTLRNNPLKWPTGLISRRKLRHIHTPCPWAMVMCKPATRMHPTLSLCITYPQAKTALLVGLQCMTDPCIMHRKGTGLRRNVTRDPSRTQHPTCPTLARSALGK